ncbi:hypothetical protein [Schaalia sp. ZJ1691]|uniref:hypothetical protein n=1 Tax=Schaalia sp. ZJ1691 TaxID=2709404 RepID=UPI0013EC60A2|nr:hypothetical protein [Schaalia sp. ZJ1691]
MTLADYVRADPRDAAFVTECEQTASELVTRRVGGAAVPESVLHAAVMEVGANLFQRRISRTGQSSFTDPETMGNPHLPALDPLTPAWPLLAPYLGPGIA